MSGVEIAIEIAGWAGAVLILLGYALITAGKVTGQSPAYQWINLFGAAGFTINGWSHGALPSAALNIVWMGIGGFALWRIWARRDKSTSATRSSTA